MMEGIGLNGHDCADFKIAFHKRIKKMSLGEVLLLEDSIRDVFEFELERRGY